MTTPTTAGLEPVRTFISLLVPAAMQQELGRIQEELRRSITGDITWVKPENIHLTLHFLGQIPAPQIEQIKTILGNVATKIQGFNIDLGSLNVFPHIHNPRVIWVGINTGFNELNKLNAVLEKQMNFTGFKADPRPFYAHLTLGRIKKLTLREEFIKNLNLVKPRLINAPINRLCLMKSVLEPSGPLYTILAEFPLT